MKKYGFGVDVGGTTCKIGFFENSGNMLDKWEIKTNTENHGASILDDIVASLESKLADAGISKDEVEGVGIGVPGPVKNDSVVCECVNLGWGTFDVAETLSEKIGLPVKVGNDANVAALGEMWKGGGEGTKNLIMATLGTGVGGGIIIDGKIVAGAHGAGGQKGARGRDGAVHPEPCFQRVRCGLSARRDRAAAERGRRAAHSGRLAVGRRSRARCLALSLPRGGVHARSQGAVRPDGDGTAARAR